MTKSVVLEKLLYVKLYQWGAESHTLRVGLQQLNSYHHINFQENTLGWIIDLPLNDIEKSTKENFQIIEALLIYYDVILGYGFW